MKIGVLSDTHDKLPPIKAALALLHDQGVGLIVHCGDWKSVETMRYVVDGANRYGLPLRGVLGNNDLDKASFINYAARAPGDFILEDEVMTLAIDGRTIIVHHGHLKPLLRRLRSETPHDILLTGHSHKPLVTHANGVLEVNPGSTAFSIPRSKQFVPSVALIDLSTLEAQIEYLKI